VLISMVYLLTCPTCGHSNPGVMVQDARVNKGSMRPLSAGLGFVPRRCAECKAPLGDTVDEAWIAEEDRDRIAAHRARKGWPALGSWRVYPQSTDATSREPIAVGEPS
jgi:hypothetical protein